MASLERSPLCLGSVSGAADHSRHRADSLRREPPADSSARSAPASRSSRRASTKSRPRPTHRRREEARGEQDVTSRSDFFFAAALSLLTIVSRLRIAPSALQLGRRAVRAGAARVRHPQASAPPAGLHPLRRARPRGQRLARRSDGLLRGPRGRVQRTDDLRRVLSRARGVRPGDRARGRRTPRREPASSGSTGRSASRTPAGALFASTVAYFAFPRSTAAGATRTGRVVPRHRGRHAPVAARPALSALDRLRGAGRATAARRAGGPRHPGRVGADLVRADDLAHRRTRALRRRFGQAGGLDRRRRRSSAAPSRSPCACRATCWSPSSSRSAAGRGEPPRRLVRSAVGLDLSGGSCWPGRFRRCSCTRSSISGRRATC